VTQLRLEVIFASSVQYLQDFQKVISMNVSGMDGDAEIKLVLYLAVEVHRVVKRRGSHIF
jgi:hypothetical protein